MSDVQNQEIFKMTATPPEYSYLIEPRAPSEYIRFFGDSNELNLVGGKNASLSTLYKMTAVRSDTTLKVPNGFSLTTTAYSHFVNQKGVQAAIHTALNNVDTSDMHSLHTASEKCRDIVYEATAPRLSDQNKKIWKEVISCYHELSAEYDSEYLGVAVRSSATAEDLPHASFAGQHDSFLNIRGDNSLIQACRCCLSSVFTPRAIAYRVENGFDHFAVALSVGVMKMIRADLGVSGVLFTCETETGHKDFVQIDSLYGLGETIVQGRANPDQFLVHKPTFRKGYRNVLSRTLGTKALTLGYSETVLQGRNFIDEQLSSEEGKQSHSHYSSHGTYSDEEDDEKLTAITAIRDCGETLTSHTTPLVKQEAYSLTSNEIVVLADDALEIEDRFGCAMDIEFAKDGLDDNIYILQARPETVNMKRRQLRASGNLVQFTVDATAASMAKVLSSCGMAVGDKLAVGAVRIVHDPTDMASLAACRPGEILVTSMTSPECVPIMKSASAVLTESGSRTCHAAIVAREMDIPCIVGATGILAALSQHQGVQVTVSCCEGERGKVYEGIVPFTSRPLGDIFSLQQAMPSPSLVRMNLADPSQAFTAAALEPSPRAGVGLVRLEFIVANSICIHPMALVESSRPGTLGGQGRSLAQECEEAFIRLRTRHFDSPAEYFVKTLAQHVGVIAAAFYPAPVNVRFSDFKSNEYAALVGSSTHEFRSADEANPLLGFRGAARYAHKRYEEAFRLEVRSIKLLREGFGLTNVEVMVPFVRSLHEAQVVKTIIREEMDEETDSLRINMMLELPCNVVELEEYAKIFQSSFSIGSNDLACLNTGTDRDSALLSSLYSDVDSATRKLCCSAIKRARAIDVPIGICGEVATEEGFLKELLIHGVDYVSCSPHSAVRTMRNIVNMVRKDDTIAKLYIQQKDESHEDEGNALPLHKKPQCE